MKFFGEEKVMGVDESSERLSGIVSRLIRGYLTIVIWDVFAVVFPTCDEGLVEKGSGRRVRGEHAVHLRMLSQLCRWECRTARVSSLGNMGVDGVTMSCRCRRGVVGNGVSVDGGGWVGRVVVWVTGPGLRGTRSEERRVGKECRL